MSHIPAGDTRYNSTVLTAETVWLQMLSAKEHEKWDTHIPVKQGVFP